VVAEEGGVVAAQWLHGGRRGLLAPLSVFTIDQALTGVLPVRYNVLRLLGLSRKVVVIDEAHSYGPWMHALLVRLLVWLGAMRVPVVVLSATLTGAGARSLVEAYVRGCRPDRLGEAARSPWRPSYPGWVYVDGDSGEISRPRAVASAREYDLDLVRVPVANGDERIEEITRRLTGVVEEGGCVLVCCTTVAEAQQTWAAIKRWLGEQDTTGRATPLPSLHLLHARYRAADRQDITGTCERIFGKKGEERPKSGAILVATQIVEQSLDLDFDLIITDLAPMAMLLQRAGRCQRHRQFDGGGDRHAAVRPPWLPPRPTVVVLDPVEEDGRRFHMPVAWGRVYHSSLLESTSRLLTEQEGEPVRIPGGIQPLVDAVYDQSFSALSLASEAEREQLQMQHAERLAGESVERELANAVHIGTPGDVGTNLRGLSEGSLDVHDEALVTTRLGADTGRVVCVYEQGDGTWSLDEDGKTKVPGWDPKSPLTREAARVLAGHLIPVPGRWLSTERGAVLCERPEPWSKNAVTRDWVPLPMRRQSDGWRGQLAPGAVCYGAAGLQVC
jgi:CRISPR-associated endonuclease/helicase Cas3